MSQAIAAALSRQTGLMREMQLIAGNIANAATTGYRREGLLFAEHVRPLGGAAGAGGDGLSIPHAIARRTDMGPGPMSATGGTLDLAVEGPGFFRVDTPEGERLTRAGAFLRSPEGAVVTPAGDTLLDAGGAPVFLPPLARDIALAEDGTLSADGAPVARLGVVLPADPADLQREAGALFRSAGALVPVDEARIRQGMLEGSNVDPVTEIARMIEVQRAYELGQQMLEREDQRIRDTIRAMNR
ncbi:MAG: flagellar hook-basal body complex protein [Rhodobacteraceae bacterium]|nr:flagellar hook-basal body complex protein [Paracoccaceae bacterium]